MKIALATDGWNNINEYVQEWLQKHGFETELFGSYMTKQDEPWVEVTAAAAKAVANGQCDEGVFFCWSGTGASIVANKTLGIRAALCLDSETAKLARVWNHANVLVLANRTLIPQAADEILEAWFDKNYDFIIGAEGVDQIAMLENRRK